jgi:hypothetical protein
MFARLAAYCQAGTRGCGSTGFWIRSEGAGFIAGLAPTKDPDDAPTGAPK